jgi:transposase
MYFEGQMQFSNKADFGRSKQTRYDRRLIGLAISIDSMGFVRHSKFYTGNVSEHGTFKDLVRLIAEQSCPNSEKPLIVMDAGISTEDNLTEIRNLGYDYILNYVQGLQKTKWIFLMPWVLNIGLLLEKQK